MPIYEYRCAQCGHKLETIQKFSDAPLTTCPACGKEALTKLVSAAGFQLKGSGWYQTDFRGGSSKPADKTDAPAKDSAGSSDAGAGAAKGDTPAAGDSKATSSSDGGAVKPATPSTPSTPAS